MGGKLGSEQRARKVRELYLSLPDTEETPTWGKPHFRVAGKIFGGLGEEGPRTTIGLKLEMEHADAMVASDPRFTRAPYVGHKGWVTVDVTDVVDWEEIRLLVSESYRLIAPKRSLAKLGAASSAATKAKKAKKAPRPATPSPRGAAKKAATKPASARTTAKPKRATKRAAKAR